MNAEKSSIVVLSIIIRYGTIAYVLYICVGFRLVMPGVSGHNIALSMLIWRTGLWFIVLVAWSRSVWVMVMDLGMSGLIYRDI